ncbi:hypothetical protein LX81_04389 [Palleronia aestuarii]|uniref:Uncharacterized protein n=1 Tax=Palleronia aestuarii TaxID=568105 RepID=A0A2W7MP53_9RHOB|nr:hypothetical protein [Palleronia aestuarii]PZX09790.1 hypothetical protein LX81_04389 [Palleronia aestuarii]
MIELAVIVVAILIAGTVLVFAAKLGLLAIASIIILAFVFPDQFGHLPSMLYDLVGRLGDLDWAGMWTVLSDWIARVLPIGDELFDPTRPVPDMDPAPNVLPPREPGEIRTIE